MEKLDDLTLRVKLAQFKKLVGAQNQIKIQAIIGLGLNFE